MKRSMRIGVQRGGGLMGHGCCGDADSRKYVWGRDTAVKRKAALSLLCLLLLQTLPALASGAVSIADLGNQTPERWRETYEAQGRTIDVDVPVEMPDAATCPVFTTAFPQSSMVDPSIPEFYQPLEHSNDFGFRNDKYLFGIGINSPSVHAKGKGNQAHRQKYLNPAEIDWDSSYAENNPTTVQEAWNFFSQEIDRCYGMDANKDLFLDGLVLRGTMRRFNDKTSQYGEATGEMGGYSFHCYQSFYGIPVLTGVSSAFDDHGTRAENTAVAPYFTANIDNESSFDFIFMRGGMEEEKIADVPLCPFDQVRAAYEGLIAKGNIRQVYTLRFGYVLFIDAAQKDVLWAIPCWVAECEYYPSAKGEHNPQFDRIELFRKDPTTRKIIINAQTGQLINPADQSKNRSKCPAIIKWK